MSFGIKNESFGYEGSGDMALLNRKFAKTCVEKKRRDRINRCLDELKDLMSQSEDKAKYQKMEKAEILEMAVTYMRSMKQTGNTMATTPTPPPNTTQYYTLAYRQCLGEFQASLAQMPEMADSSKAKILSHMSQRYIDMLAAINAANKLNAAVEAEISPNHHRRRQLKRARFSSGQESFSSGSCSSLEQLESGSEDVDFSGASSERSLSRCSSPKGALDVSGEEGVWRPW
jgi:hypothetical protein